MEKITFRDFLLEVDIGDLQYAKQAELQRQDQAGNNASRNDFGNEMKGSSPSKNNVIVDKYGQKYRVTGNDMNGINVIQLGGTSTNVFKHGTKFKPLGKSKHGVTFFQEI